MAEEFRFFDSTAEDERYYDAREFTQYFDKIISTGLMRGQDEELEVNADGSNLITTVGTGVAFILGRQYVNDAPLQLTHDPEGLGQNRIDRVVARLDLTTQNRYVRAFVKKGSAGSNPQPPALQRDNTIYEISLAQVPITGGQSYIDASSIIDERGIDNICPWAGSNILPSYDDNMLADHMNNLTVHIPYVVTEGSANNYTASIDGVNFYKEGMALSAKINVANTGDSTININGLGAKRILKGNGNTLSSGNLKANSIYTLRYNGTDFIVQGEGGEYGTATPSDVLIGHTIGTDQGLVEGTMPNHGSLGTVYSGDDNTVYEAGYYNGFTLGKRRVANIKKSVNFPSNATTVTASFNIGFLPKDWAVHLQLGFSNNDHITGHMVKTKDNFSYFSSDALRLDYGPTGGSKELYCYVDIRDSYVSGNTLYVVFTFERDNFKGQYYVLSQTTEVNVIAWG